MILYPLNKFEIRTIVCMVFIDNSKFFNSINIPKRFDRSEAIWVSSNFPKTLCLKSKYVITAVKLRNVSNGVFSLKKSKFDEHKNFINLSLFLSISTSNFFSACWMSGRMNSVDKMTFSVRLKIKLINRSCQISNDDGEVLIRLRDWNEEMLISNQEAGKCGTNR